MDQGSPLSKLIEALKNESPEVLLGLVKKCDSTPNIQITEAIILIKLKRAQEALQILKHHKDHPQTQYLKLYAYYSDNQFNQVINECKSQTPEEVLLLAQAYAKLEQFDKSIEQYTKLIKENKLQHDQQDIMTNLLNVVIQQNNQDQMQQYNQITLDFLKRNKNQYSRELLLNHALLNLALGDKKTAKELTIRFENMVKVENPQDDDLILSQIILDLINQNNLSDTIKHYETFENSPEQPVILNNLVYYQEKLKLHQHDALKKIEEAINSNYKFTPQQIHILKLNRAVLQIIRNRPTKEHDLPLTLQIAYNKQKWDQPISDPFQYLIFATHNENSQHVLELMNIPNWNQNQVLSTFVMSHLLKVDDSKFQHLIDQIAQTNKRLLCSYYVKRGNLDKALKYYQQDQISQVALLCLEKGQMEQAYQFIDSLQYQGIEDMNEIENLEKNVTLSKKVDVVEKKIEKKKKKRIRYPKNFDKANPGPAPNPERWLPKYERKEWKKKKQIRSRTQGAGGAGKETMNTFQAQGASTAQLNVTQKSQKNKKRK